MSVIPEIICRVVGDGPPGRILLSCGHHMMLTNPSALGTQVRCGTCMLSRSEPQWSRRGTARCLPPVRIEMVGTPAHGYVAERDMRFAETVLDSEIDDILRQYLDPLSSMEDRP